MEAESQTLTQNAQLQNDLLQQIVELNEKVQDQENIIYSLEHTLSVYEKEKKQFFDEKMGFESVLIELQLENESKDRTIKRQNEEIDKLMTDLRHAKNEFEAFKNTNLSSKLPYNANDDIKQNTDNDAPVLVDEEPISIANETDSNNRTRSPSNVLEEFTKSIKINLFSPKAKGESHAVQLAAIRAKYDKLQQLNIVLEKSVNIQREELNILKQTNVDIITQITVKQKEINHLGECLEDNQLGFTRYKEESEQKLYQWKAEKKHWFDEYKKTREANEQLKQQKRKLEQKNRKLEKWKNKQRKSNETLKGPDRAEPSIICSEFEDTITMDKITLDSLQSKEITKGKMDVPHILRVFKSLKLNEHDDLMEKMMEIEEENEEGIKVGIEILYEILMRCVVEYDEEKQPETEQIFEMMKKQFDDGFTKWTHGGADGHGLASEFTKYIVKCLEISVSMKELKLRLFPLKFSEFDIDNILDYQDVMQRDDMFDVTPRDKPWFCSFPSIIGESVARNDNNQTLNETQIIDIINNRKAAKYDIFQCKLWMFQM
eukprot:251384_1